MLYRVRLPFDTGSLSFKSGNTGNNGNKPDLSGEFSIAAGNKVGTAVGTTPEYIVPVVKSVPAHVPAVFPGNPRKIPVNSTTVPGVPTVPTFKSRETNCARTVETIRSAWRRIFNLDVDAARRARGLPPVSDHIRSTRLGGPTPLVDQLLAEIAQGVPAPAPMPLEKLVKDSDLPERDADAILLRARERRERLSEPGITVGDVIRVFGGKCKTVISDADWQEIPQADRKAIEDDLALWTFQAGRWRHNISASTQISGLPMAICRRCSSKKTLTQQWRKSGRIVSAMLPGVRHWLCC